MTQCAQCGFKNDPKNRFCGDCGAELRPGQENHPLPLLSELYGKEAEVLFFIEGVTGKITGIVNPTQGQLERYRQGILQKVTIEAAGAGATAESAATILTFIRQSKDYLGEDFNENLYRGFSPADLKKEYLRLFEKILKAKAQRQDAPKTGQAKTDKK
jgi:hypothetical protein